MPRRYSPDMTPAEQALLLAECDALDAAYASAAVADAASAEATAVGVGPETLAEELDAAYEQSGEHFERYVAGDR